MKDERDGASNPIDRRSLFRGAAALAVGGLAAPAALAQTATDTGGAPSAPASVDAGKELDAQTSRVLRWAGREPADWVRPREGADHNVVIVGAGHSGLSIAYALQAQGRRQGRRDRSRRARPGRHLAHGRTHASVAHAEDDVAGAGRRQRRAELPRVVRDVEWPRGVRRARSNSTPRVGRLLELVSADHGHEGPLPYAPRRDRAAGRLAAPAPGVRRRGARRDDAQARARERLRRRGRPRDSGRAARAPRARLDPLDGTDPARDAARQSRRRDRRGLERVRRRRRVARGRRGRSAHVQPPAVHRIPGPARDRAAAAARAADRPRLPERARAQLRAARRDALAKLPARRAARRIGAARFARARRRVQEFSYPPGHIADRRRARGATARSPRRRTARRCASTT